MEIRIQLDNKHKSMAKRFAKRDEQSVTKYMNKLAEDALELEDSMDY